MASSAPGPEFSNSDGVAGGGEGVVGAAGGAALTDSGEPTGVGAGEVAWVAAGSSTVSPAGEALDAAELGVDAADDFDGFDLAGSDDGFDRFVGFDGLGAGVAEEVRSGVADGVGFGLGPAGAVGGGPGGFDAVGFGLGFGASGQATGFTPGAGFRPPKPPSGSLEKDQPSYPPITTRCDSTPESL